MTVPDPNGLSIGTRIALTMIIVLIILFALFFIGGFMGAWEDTAQGEEVPPSKFDERIAQLDREAIEEAYQNQIMHLFLTWMKDSTGQPGRAVNGARTARRAYIGAMTEIERVEARPR